MKRSTTPEQREKDSAFWKQYFELQPSVPMPEIGEDGKCDRSDCPGRRIPGYIKPGDGNAGAMKEAVSLRCTTCHGEKVYPLSAQLPKESSRQSPPLAIPVATVNPLASTQIGQVGLMNLKGKPGSVLDQPQVHYIGRQIAWKGNYLKDSPLSNPYKVGRDGSRSDVCEKFLVEELNPALEWRRGPVWNEIARLAAIVAKGESICLACWCLPERCHGADVAAAISMVAREEVSNA